MYGIDWLARSVVIAESSTTIQALLDAAFSKERDFSIVGFASDPASAAKLVADLKPDIVTIDFGMIEAEISAFLEMTADFRSVCKIIVSDFATADIFVTARLLRHGASACISKRELTNEPTKFFAKINAAYKSMRNSSAYPGVPGVPMPRRSAELAEAEWSAVRYPVPLDEQRRLKALRTTQLANAVRERPFDLITKNVAEVTGFPVCLLTFIDEHTQWIKSAHGFEGLTTDRSDAFCNYTLADGDRFVVPNAMKDDRFVHNPLVAGSPGIRSYAGSAVVASDGTRMGALCLIDIKPRHFSDRVLAHLSSMANVVGSMIDQRIPKAA